MRIRSIKPEFWRSDDIDALCLPDRLLFIGLWSYVDDSGVGVDKESSIAADLFAGDLARDFTEASVRVHGGLNRLAEAGLITRYMVKGKRYLHITSWTKHQKINRPTESRHPSPTCEDAAPQEERHESSVRVHAVVVPGAGEQGSRGVTTSSAAAASKLIEAKFVEFWAAYPRKDDKKAALVKFKSAVWTDKVDPDRLVLAAQSYARQVAGKERTFVKLAATWLNKGSYDNEPEQTGLSLVPSLSTDFESIRTRADAHAAGRLIGLTYIEPSQPMSDKTPSREWSRLRGVEFIDAHADEIRAALTERKTG